jgi:2-amino-4-hydroxy-6-hydroxymethyldihydropteridine diphosphokinase
MPLTCYLSLGSNLGDREGYLRQALERLAAHPALHLLRLSSVYETAPVGVTDQPDFLNLVVELEARLSARELLAVCHEIENGLGRTRERHWGPRTIDLDLLLCDDLTLDEPDLQLPHPRLLERQFVLVPLAEIAPDLRLPEGRLASAAADSTAAGLVCRGPLPPAPTVT